MSKVISVIIPAYNVDKYIKKCMESVLLQTYSDLEIIVIDDGSTDDTAKLISSFTSDERVIILKQKNSGVTAARNNGINTATGELMTFVDSDDWLEPDMYEKLYTVMAESNADVAACDYNLVYDDHIETKYSNMHNEVVDIDPTNYFLKYCCCRKPNNYIWTRLYRTDIVRGSGIRFENYKLGDDTLFNFKLLPYMKRAAHISSSLYNYLQRTNSNVYTVAKRGNLATVYADTFESLVRHYGQNEFNVFLDVMPIHAYTRLRSVIFYSRLAGLDEEEIAESIKVGFREREIANYLHDTSGVDFYAALTSISKGNAEKIKQTMLAAANDPKKLIGVELV